MRFAGIDVASETHAVAMVDERSEVTKRPTSFREDAQGYAELIAILGDQTDILVAMEATGHYWKNLFAALVSAGFQVAVLNPLQTHRFGGEALERTKTDAIDAVSIARFAAQKRPVPTRLPDVAIEELRELVHLRDRLVQDLGDRVRQVHRLVDLGFPEFTQSVPSLDSQLATTILKLYPTAKAFERIPFRHLSRLKYDARHRVGDTLAKALIAAAKVSVGRHHGDVYRVQVRYFCEDIDVLRERIKQLDRDITAKLDKHEIGKLLTTINGIGTLTAARVIAIAGNPAEFRDAGAFAAYVGVVPGLKQSGKHQGARAGLTRIGNLALRSALFMPTLAAVRFNPWLRSFYERLRARGKLPMVSLLAAMRKLLTAIYSVAKHRRPFVPLLGQNSA
jgi:transposase